MTNRTKTLLFTILILLGLSLVVGATLDMPTSAQGIVTGRNSILLSQLVDRVGASALLSALRESDELNLDRLQPIQRPSRRRTDRLNNRQNNESRRGVRNNNDRHNDRRRARSNAAPFNDAVEDQLERIRPEIVYQVAVDANLLTRTEADRMLAEVE